ncbi:MATE family efflux transporter [Niameybacter massiliensis]|uniref:Multidrug export protein MepA n=1 Tax=Holtiella tumoricola TaxID=3018743 RepID=A0AA42DRB1_9FIRM|nr:MATE family efflux transporter [Holtiella tumoricola]MDA3733556.1 MATE family efflux transporter [Holtiella tumoricola]
MSKVENKISQQLASEPVKKLMLKFSIPCIISLLVSALYNIVDQIFIGQGVGYFGTAATSVAFPLTVIALAIALMIGDGAGAFFSLKIGEKDTKSTELIVGNAITMFAASGIVLALISSLFLKQILGMFGATEAVMPYAMDYTRIIAIGLPVAMFSTGFNSIIRGDGNPKFAMISMLCGALINTVLDPIFIFTFDMGVKGAAYATIIGQLVSTILGILYIKKFNNIKFKFKFLKPNFNICKTTLTYGISSFITQAAIAIVAIATNNVLTKYGAASVYGSEIPLSIFGIVTKVNQIMLSVLLGIAVGAQPILGFNYGAKKMGRVKETVKIALTGAVIVSTLGLICFEFFPQQIVNLFGAGDAMYNEFGVMYFRIFLAGCILNAIQIVCIIFFQAIGQPMQSGILSLSRQIIFYLPGLFILPIVMGIKGAIYAAPIADILAFILAMILMSMKWKQINALEDKEESKLSKVA